MQTENGAQAHSGVYVHSWKSWLERSVTFDDDGWSAGDVLGGKGAHQGLMQAIVCSPRAMREALSQGQFHLEYQPKFDLRSGDLLGLEALMRWIHPRHGTISPELFIPMAEKCGQITSLGAWAIAQACSHLAEWARAGDPKLSVAVNVSPLQLDEHFCGTVSDALDTYGIEPERLYLEITESVAIQDVSGAEGVLAQLIALGVQLSLDDFGSGCAGIGSLYSAGFAEVKLDRGFLRRRGTPAQKARVLHAVVDLARCFGARVVAEGVESASDMHLVKAAGCDLAQGFYYSRPLGAPAVEELLQSRPVMLPQSSDAAESAGARA